MRTHLRKKSVEALLRLLSNRVTVDQPLYRLALTNSSVVYDFQSGDTSWFPVRTQALAGGVFNTLAQIGNSVGLAITSIVAASVTARDVAEGGTAQGSLWEGYKASFWTCFGAW